MEIAINLTAIILSSLSLIVAVASLALTIGQKLSTHRIEWKPLQINDPLAISDEESKDVDDEDSKILKEALNLQRNGKKQRDQDPLAEIFETNNF